MAEKDYKFVILDQDDQPIEPVEKEGSAAQHFSASVFLITQFRQTRLKSSFFKKSNAKQDFELFISFLVTHKDLKFEKLLAFGNNDIIIQDLKTHLTDDENDHDYLFQAIKTLQIPGVGSCNFTIEENKIYSYKITPKFEDIPSLRLGTAAQHFKFCVHHLISALNGGMLSKQFYEEELNQKIASCGPKNLLSFFITYLQKHRYFSAENKKINELENILKANCDDSKMLTLFLITLQEIHVPKIKDTKIYLDEIEIKPIKYAKILTLKEIAAATIIKYRNSLFSDARLLEISDRIIQNFPDCADSERKFIVKVEQIIHSYNNEYKFKRESLEYKYLNRILIAINCLSSNEDKENSIPNFQQQKSDKPLKSIPEIPNNPCNEVNKIAEEMKSMFKTKPKSSFATNMKKLNTMLFSLLKEYHLDKQRASNSNETKFLARSPIETPKR